MVITPILIILGTILGLRIALQTMAGTKASPKSRLSSVDKAFVNNQPEIITGHEYVGPPIRRSFMDTIKSRLYPQDGVDPHLDLGLNDTLAQDPQTIPYRRGIIPLNIETRGVIPNYDQVGYLFNETSNERYPLFGRPKYIGSSQWEYYAKDDSRNRIPLPVETRNDKELYDDDTVQIKGVEGDFTANIYEQEKLRYIPYVY